MTIDIFKVPQAEMEILEILWESGKPLRTAQLVQALPARTGRIVKSSTVNTLAARLAKKGLIVYVQSNGKNLYLPRIHKEDYQFFVAKRFLDTLFHGSVVELVSSLLTDMDLSRESLEALKTLVASAVLPKSEWEASGMEWEEPEACADVHNSAGFLSIFMENAFPEETRNPAPATIRRKKKRRRTKCVPRAS